MHGLLVTENRRSSLPFVASPFGPGCLPYLALTWMEAVAAAQTPWDLQTRGMSPEF